MKPKYLPNIPVILSDSEASAQQLYNSPTDPSLRSGRQQTQPVSIPINMKTLGGHNYFVYIVTNKNKTVLYTGVTNNLYRRLYEHETNSKPFRHRSFAGQYNAYYLLYYERFEFIDHAIAREKEIKGWRRSKKEVLINMDNPEWHFLNDHI